MARRRHLLDALSRPAFRRLLAVRLAGQFGDGLFQAGLAGTVLFNPERQAHAADVAAGFAVLLLPYSAIGPFAGVLLDRWWRQRVLARANLVRGVAVLAVAAEIAGGLGGVGFYASALVIISISRFVLSALGTALPRVIAAPELVTANAFSATVGTVFTTLGAAAAVAVRAGIGDTDADYAVIAGAALLPYLVAAVAARGFTTTELGPSEQERAGRETPAAVLRGLHAGLTDVRRTPPVAAALATIGVHRLFYGIWLVCAVLLYRNYFHGNGFFRAGLGGLGQLVALIATGGALAAVVTPAAFRRFGPVRWAATMLGVSAAAEIGFGLPYDTRPLLVGALVVGFGAQAVKISVDTLVQQDVEDAFRGRVFALYDVIFNVALVVAATVTAVALPADGHSPAAVLAVGGAWAVAGGVYLTRCGRTTR